MIRAKYVYRIYTWSAFNAGLPGLSWIASGSTCHAGGAAHHGYLLGVLMARAAASV